MFFFFILYYFIFGDFYSFNFQFMDIWWQSGRSHVNKPYLMGVLLVPQKVVQQMLQLATWASCDWWKGVPTYTHYHPPLITTHHLDELWHLLYHFMQGRIYVGAEGGYCPPSPPHLKKKKTSIKKIMICPYIYIYIFVSPPLKYLDIDLQENK